MSSLGFKPDAPRAEKPEDLLTFEREKLARKRGYRTLDDLIARLQDLKEIHGGGSRICGRFAVYPEFEQKGIVKKVVEYYWLFNFNMERTRVRNGYKTKSTPSERR